MECDDAWLSILQFFLYCVSRGVRVCSSTCGPSSDGQGVGLPLRCAVLFVFLMLDTARLRCRFGYTNLRRHAPSTLPSPVAHGPPSYELLQYLEYYLVKLKANNSISDLTYDACSAAPLTH